MIESTRRGIPISTYRLQLHAAFGFEAARATVSYLSQLGVTDAYTSPYLAANPGSTHGYDISDHTRLNPELGAVETYEAFSQALRAHAFGHILDIVPNHMAADAASNPWWRDVLENGPSSIYSDFFDIDWDPIKPELKNRVLLPILGGQYGVVLERGELRLQYRDHRVVLQYGTAELPLNPRSLPIVLGHDEARVGHSLPEDDPDTREYLSILTALDNLPAYTERDANRVAERHREKEVARDRLTRLLERAPIVRDHLDACVRYANGTPGDPASFDLLHRLLERQAYRLAYWRTAFDEINYRRFFDVNGLVALRMEEPRVFDAAHAKLRDLVAGGHVTGFRVDHPDGLFDPKEYGDRLQAMTAAVRPNDLAAGPDGRFYVVVEKILTGDETLPADWPVAGTTGYDFLNLVAGLFIDARNVQPLRRAYARLTGRQAAFDEVAYQSKRVITLTSMASELSVLAHALNRLSEASRRHRDFTLDSCRKALREVLACVPVYRTYHSERGWGETDATVVESAIAEAMRRNPVMEESIFRFIKQVLLPLDDEPAGGPSVPVPDRRRFAMKFQQLSAPVQAKGVEDTAFYRHHLLVAANDVGGHPHRLGVPVDAFHRANARRLESRPYEMLTTATHDTKRGEDARLRLTVLSERPADWRKLAAHWMRVNARHRTRIGSTWAPDRNDEYLFYQALVGVWPHAVSADNAVSPPAGLAARVDAYMQKAVREAKVHTSWIDEDQEYGGAVAQFVARTLDEKTGRRFLVSFVPFARRVAAVGVVNSLAQLVLKLTSPGVPDVYQGTEFWDCSLVDPDNRRPVDYDERRRVLTALEPALAAPGQGREAIDDVRELLAHWPDGRIKLLFLASGLRFRREHAEFMARASYVPLAAEGPAADHLIAFARQSDEGALIVVVPRLVAGLVTGDRLPFDATVWTGTTLTLPPGLHGRRYRHVTTGERVDAAEATTLSIRDVLGTSPVAWLWPEDSRW